MSKTLFALFIILSLAAMVLSGCAPQPVILEVYAGDSMKKPVLEIKGLYEEQHPNVTVNCSFAASKTLEETMRAIQQGDIYIATLQDVERMKQNGLILESQPLATLTPAIIVRKGDKTVKSWDDLARDGVRISILTPELGAAGSLAKKIIGKSPLKDSIEANIISLGAPPNEKTELLLKKEVDALIIWDSVAKSNPKLEAVQIPADITEILEMWIAIPSYTASEKDASAFVEFVAGAEGKQAFKNAGFSILEK